MRHEEMTELDRKPDFTFTKKSAPKKLNLYYACFVVELMVKNLDYIHMGKLIVYNEEVLNANPSRKYIISVLTNLDDMLLLKSEIRLDKKRGGYEIVHRFSNCINFWTVGYKYIRQLHNSPKTAGYDEKYNFTIMISRGYLFYFNVKYSILDT